MGAVSRAAYEGGASVNGIIPRPLAAKEIAGETVGHVEVVETMHQRKFRMFELSDAFITLPGGIGTLEELFETISWIQLGIHRKPVGLLNVNGFYDPLRQLIDHQIDQGFIQPQISQAASRRRGAGRADRWPAPPRNAGEFRSVDQARAGIADASDADVAESKKYAPNHRLRRSWLFVASAGSGVEPLHPGPVCGRAAPHLLSAAGGRRGLSLHYAFLLPFYRVGRAAGAPVSIPAPYC